MAFTRQENESVTILKGLNNYLESRKMSEDEVTNDLAEEPEEEPVLPKHKPIPHTAEKPKPPENKVVRLLEKNPLGLTLPEMAGGPRQVKKIRLLRPMLAEAIRGGLVMPVSQRAGNTVYRLVKFLGPR
jgi:hypothetical protein